MEPIQEQHERAVGDKLIAWLNDRDGSNYSFIRRGDLAPDQAPDLIYGNGAQTLGIEVVGAYYDKADSTLQWQGARGRTNAPQRWSGVGIDDSLLKIDGNSNCTEVLK